MRLNLHTSQPSFIVSKCVERADRPDFPGSALSVVLMTPSGPSEGQITLISPGSALRMAHCCAQKNRRSYDHRFSRAIDEARTRDLHLGKVAYYQLYYYRICCRFRGGHELIYLSVSGMSTVFLIIGYYPNYLTSADPTPRTSSLP